MKKYCILVCGLCLWACGGEGQNPFDPNDAATQSAFDTNIAFDVGGDARNPNCPANVSGACVFGADGQPLRRDGQICSYQGGPYSTQQRGTFPPFTLPRCGGEPYAFYGREFCEAKLTLLLIDAGWCQPSRLQARTLEREMVRRFQGCGLNVVEVLTQDNAGSEPDREFCEGWVRQYGLSNVVLREQNNAIAYNFAATSLPFAFIVGPTGTILYRQSGINETALFATLRTELTRQGVDVSMCERTP